MLHWKSGGPVFSLGDMISLFSLVMGIQAILPVIRSIAHNLLLLAYQPEPDLHEALGEGSTMLEIGRLLHLGEFSYKYRL